MSAKADAITAAWRTTQRLQRAWDAGWHRCWCGEVGAFRETFAGPFFCRSHVVFDADGSFHTIPQI